MTKNYIPTINISSLIKNNFETQRALKTIKEIEKACVNVGFFQVTGHGLNLKEIKKICDVGNKFFNLSDNKKRKLSPKKWNKKNKNLYRGYFPNDVNGKEGLDIGDLKVTKTYSSRLKNKYIEHLNLNKSFNKASINELNKYYLKDAKEFFKASKLIKLRMIPVGQAFLYINQNFPNINLYTEDLRHPSKEGTYLAALMIFTSLSNKTPIGNSYTMDLNPEVAKTLQKVAWLTHKDFQKKIMNSGL